MTGRRSHAGPPERWPGKPDAPAASGKEVGWWDRLGCRWGSPKTRAPTTDRWLCPLSADGHRLDTDTSPEQVGCPIPGWRPGEVEMHGSAHLPQPGSLQGRCLRVFVAAVVRDGIRADDITQVWRWSADARSSARIPSIPSGLGARHRSQGARKDGDRWRPALRHSHRKLLR